MSSKEHLLELLQNDRPDRLIKDLREYFSIRPIAHPEQYSLLRNQYEELRGYYISGTEQFKDITGFKKEFVRSMSRFIRQNIGDEPWRRDVREEDINLSLSDIRNKFLNILNQNGLPALVAFSRYIIKDPVLKKSLADAAALVTEVDFQYCERVRPITFNAVESSDLSEAVRILDLTEEKKKKLLARAVKIIGSIEEENLVHRWKLTFRNLEATFSWHNPAGDRQLLLSPLEVIQIPFYLRSDDQYLQYKRLMIQAQDAYLAHRYEEAHELFLRVRNEVDPESSQLYEMLMVTYYKKHRGALLVDNYIANKTKNKRLDLKDNPLYQLYLYASRFHLLQGNRKIDNTGLINKTYPDDKKPGSDLIAQAALPVFSYTGAQNLKTIAQELLLRLAKRHTRILDQLSSGITSRKKVMVELWRCVSTARDIYQYLKPDYIVFTTIISELLGASASFWITIDSAGHPTNVHEEFDAIGHFQAILGMVVNDKFRHQATDLLPSSTDHRKSHDEIHQEVISDLAALVSDGLRLKYVQLPEAPTPTPDEAAATYQPYVELMLSYQVADALLPNSGLFFEVPFLELGNGEGKVDWFQLGRGRKLYTRFTAPDFDALAYFENLCLRKDTFTGIPSVGAFIEHLIQKYCARLQDKTFELYRTINLMGEFDLARAGRQRIGEILYCYRNWQICFDVNEDESFLKKCHDEVVGNGILFWWAIGRHGLHANPRNLPQGIIFDALEELNWLNNQSGLSNREADFLTITENYLNRIVIPRSNEVGRRTHSQLNPSADDQLAILNFSEKVIQLAGSVGPLSQLENYVYDELIKEKTFRWYDIQDNRFINEDRILQHGIDAIPALEEAMDTFSMSNRFTIEHLQNMVTLKREEDITKSYIEDFSRNQERNYEEDTIVLFVNMIERLIAYHKVTGNPKLLVMPYEELVTGKGKVPWARIPWTFFAIDKVLTVEKDDSGHAARIGVKKWRIIGGRIRPRPRVRKIAHFDFRDAYFYVKYNYETKAMLV